MTLRIEPKNTKGDTILYQLAKELGIPGEYTEAARALRWVLHSIRDHTDKKNSYRILAYLPTYMRVVYVDQWDHLNDEITPRVPPASLTNLLDENIRPADIVKAVLKIIGTNITYADWEEIYNCLPEYFKDIIIEEAIQQRKDKI